jgi:hypothetical protein
MWFNPLQIGRYERRIVRHINDRLHHEFCGTCAAAMRSRAGSAKDAGRNNFFAAESFGSRRTSMGRDAMTSHRKICHGGNDETDLDQV